MTGGQGPVQATRTYLQLAERRAFREGFGAFPRLVVERVARPTAQLYRSCYQTVGEAYHWRDRWDWTDAQIDAHLAQPDIGLHVATDDGRFAGWYELRRVPDDGSVEIAYFGLAPGAIGRGMGKHLLSCAVRDAWALGATRVWVHTCTLDHPHALPNYQARGFSPYKTETYTVDSIA
jgi:GNAT superfamily N-acetyltransferase